MKTEIRRYLAVKLINCTLSVLPDGEFKTLFCQFLTTNVWKL